jgi:hypothetical protein
MKKLREACDVKPFKNRLRLRRDSNHLGNAEFNVSQRDWEAGGHTQL